MKLSRFPAFLVLASVALAGCTQYATISETRPKFRPIRAAIGALASIDRSIERGMAQEHSEPRGALGELLTAASETARQLQSNPNDKGTRDDYNFAVSRVFGVIKSANL